MRTRGFILAAALTGAAFTLAAAPAAARDIPDGGLTVQDVQAWLQGDGYAAKIETNSDGAPDIASAADGSDFHIYFYDCNSGGRCASMQFSAGFDTKGAFDTSKMNQWNNDKRWTKAYVDKVNDPWIERDIDLSPGGTYEQLDDEFSIWRQALSDFRKYIGW